MNPIVRYQNGNYTVTINTLDGTKIRENDLDNLTPAFAENCDVKITDKCDGGCAFCYEGCTPNGKHGDILNPKFLDTLHPYTELAINGNDLSHPDLLVFLQKIKDKNIIVNMTVNQIHFERHYTLIKTLIQQKAIYGLGISLRKPTDEFINIVKQFPNAVIHTINGILSPTDYEILKDNGLKLLILGYKQLKRGIEYYESHEDNVHELQNWLYNNLKEMLNHFKVVSFDNLAIKQLDVKRLLSDRQWDEFYMGDDGNYTFYIDMVDNMFAKNSLSMERYPLMDNIDDMFNFLRSKE
nr:MAG TPA: Molybdenum cofactor biosynthesis protein A barrel, LIGAND BINDING PROTEIN [Caudoviricetes sp.]